MIKMNKIIKAVEQQPRLQEFVYCLYTNDKYQLNKLKSLDSVNREIAFEILEHVYPENPFKNIIKDFK